jgi:poly(3-hydroxybutyrate) depolymerase
MSPSTRPHFAIVTLLFLLTACTAEKDDDNSAADTNSSTTEDAADTVPAERYASDLATACPEDFQKAPASGQNDGYPAADQQRGFYLQFPASETYSGPRPMMILFNGTGGDGKKAFDSYNGQDFLDAGFIVLGPDSIANGTIWPVWDAARTPDQQDLPNKDLIYLDSLMDCVAAHHEVDKNRIYVAGMSAGGIMSNHVLQRRSQLLAGGIVGSGVFDFTSPIPPEPMDAMGVVVTWGGDNDMWGGDSDDSDVNVPEFVFAEQAAMASKFYADIEGGSQMWVRANDHGHAWVKDAGPLFIDYLLAHPKGFAESQWTLPDALEGATYTAGDTVAKFEPKIVVVCPETEDQNCGAYCQLLADCAVENTTVGPVLGPQLKDLGFTGEDYAECGGCLESCSAAQTGTADEAVLTCFRAAQETAECEGGVEGALPLVDAVNDCCDGQFGKSDVCQQICGSIMSNSILVQTKLFINCTPYRIELAGEWLSDFDEALSIDNHMWGTSAIVEYDNTANWAITHYPEDDEYNPGKFARQLWTDIDADSFYHCTELFDAETAEAAKTAEATADPSDLANGCGGISWSNYSLPIE